MGTQSQIMHSSEHRVEDTFLELCIGDLAEVHGLQGAKELNGRWGRLVSRAEATRFGVKLDGIKEPKSIKTSNLKKIIPSVLCEIVSMPASFMDSTPGTPIFKGILRLLPAQALLAFTCCRVGLHREIQGANEAWERAILASFGGTLTTAQCRCPQAVGPSRIYRALADLRRKMRLVEVEQLELWESFRTGVETVVVPVSQNLEPYGDSARRLIEGVDDAALRCVDQFPKPFEIGTACCVPCCSLRHQYQETCNLQTLILTVAPNKGTVDGDRKMHEAYAAALEQVLFKQSQSVALGGIPLGESGVQSTLAARIAVEEIRSAMARLPPNLSLRVVMVARNPALYSAFKESLSEMCKRVNEDLLEILPVILLDSMLPGQRLSFEANDPQVAIHPDCDRFAMIGIVSGPQGRTRLGAGVEVHVCNRTAKGDSIRLEVVGGRRFSVPGILQRESAIPDKRGGFHYSAAVLWCSDEDDSCPTKSELQKSSGLSPLVDKWLTIVRGGHERQPGQIEGILQNLGPMPPANHVVHRAFWVCALINPLPALGVALEIRPAALMAKTANQLLDIALEGLRGSINYLNGFNSSRSLQ